MLAFPTSGTTHLPSRTSIDAGKNTLLGVVEAGVSTTTNCSTHVLSCPQDDLGARVLDIDTDLSAEVLTHIGGLSLFEELEPDSVDEVFNDHPLKDVMGVEELADYVVTHIGSSSLFLEQSMDTHQERDGEIDKPTCLEHGMSGI